MTKLLAKIALPASKAAGDPDRETGTPGHKKAGKPRRGRWILTALMLSPLVTAFSLLGTGAANASGAFTTTVYCNSYNHTIYVHADAVNPPNGGYIKIVAWFYSYQTRQWSQSQVTSPYRSGYVDYTADFGPWSWRPGQYWVDVDYYWYRADWSLLASYRDQGPDVNQAVGSHWEPSQSCTA
jgi:hypothetical protein